MCSPSGAPLLPQPTSKSHLGFHPQNSNAFVVKAATSVLRVLFRLLDFALSIPSLFCTNQTSTRRAPAKKTKTVVIVGGNFAGLSALRELQTYRNTCKDGDHLRIILIDKREYSEYTPGILRLFCEPEHFFHLVQKLPETTDSCSFERIQGTVMSIVAEDAVEGLASSGKVLTYVPTIGDNANDTYTQSPPSTMSFSYDFLILATGATYTEPISPAKVVEGKAATTILGRYEEWKRAHDELKSSKRVLILGGGAVGVELAAEILDRNYDSTDGTTTTVTIVDAQPSLVALFPKGVGVYAEEWLAQKGAVLRLGVSLRSWNDRSCTLEDGTILHADIVYVCFGNRPNSEMIRSPPKEKKKNEASKSCTNQLFFLTKRRNVVVNDTLQLTIAGDDKHSLDIPWFACGDVASPPTNDEKQAFQAEMQGKLAARNVIKLLESSCGTARNNQQPDLLRYPIDIAGADRIPLVFVLSLGRYNGVLGFNDLFLPGSLAAVFKWILEYTKVSQMRGSSLGNVIWKIGDAVTLFLSRTIFRSPPMQGVTSITRTNGTNSKSSTWTHVTQKDTKISMSKAQQKRTAAPRSPHGLQDRQLEEQLKLS